MKKDLARTHSASKKRSSKPKKRDDGESENAAESHIKKNG